MQLFYSYYVLIILQVSTFYLMKEIEDIFIVEVDYSLFVIATQVWMLSFFLPFFFVRFYSSMLLWSSAPTPEKVPGFLDFFSISAFWSKFSLIGQTQN